MPKLEIHYDPNSNWAALYVDGQMETVGDAYVAEEHAFDLAGVAIVRDDAFLRGQDTRDGAAQTLDEVTAYRRQRDAARSEAELLRQQAQALLDRAEQIAPQ